MVSKKLAIGGGAVACAACCAPLVVPLLWPTLVGAGIVGAGSAGTGWLAGLSLDAILWGGVAMALLAGAGVWYRQSRKRQSVSPPFLTEVAACDLHSCAPKARGGGEQDRSL